MSRKDVVKQFSHPARSDAEHASWVRKNAADFAQLWKEDCYVYGDLSWGNTISYTPGPDADHPKTTPTFVAKYNAPAKKARVES